MKNSFLAAAVLTSIAAVSVAQADDTSTEREKCYGVARAQKNDCAAKDKSSSCAGRAKKDGDANDWVYVPKGLCDKLVGGVKG